MSPQQTQDDALREWIAANLAWLTRQCTPPWNPAEDTTSTEETGQ